MAKKQGFIKQLSKPVKIQTKSEDFSWGKPVVNPIAPESGNLHRRSTMQVKSPKYNSSMCAEYKEVQKKRK